MRCFYESTAKGHLTQPRERGEENSEERLVKFFLGKEIPEMGLSDDRMVAHKEMKG